MIDSISIAEAIQRQIDQESFSGSVLVQENWKTIFAQGYGLANRAENIPNAPQTRFGLASGCKIFTAVAICQLVEQGLISFEARLADCLNIPFPNFDPDVTIHHLLTHSSGIPDYFDESVMDDFEELWLTRPTYTIRQGKDFLPMFQNQPMTFSLGERFAYNNAGFIVLGLIVEQQSGLPFTDYVIEHIFGKAGMADSGYFAMDQLPERTAYGYINNEDGTWRTNIFSLPIIGGADGGAFTTGAGMATFWHALFNRKLLNEETTKQLLTPHQLVNEEWRLYYGYGVWIQKKEGGVIRYHVEGHDPGVVMISLVYPDSGLLLTILGNQEPGTWPLYQTLEAHLVE